MDEQKLFEVLRQVQNLAYLQMWCGDTLFANKIWSLSCEGFEALKPNVKSPQLSDYLSDLNEELHGRIPA